MVGLVLVNIIRPGLLNGVPVRELLALEADSGDLIASVAVDIRIGQLVDVPNVGATAILPLDIFVGD